MLTPFLVLAVLGCRDPDEPIRGTIRLGPGELAEPAGGVNVAILDLDRQLYDKTVTAPDGTFEALGPRGETVYAEISGDDLVRAGFVGQVGQGPFDVPDGELFAWEVSRMDALRASYADCGTPEGGVIHGEIRLFGAGSPSNAPIFPTSFARLLTDDEPIEACYLDATGQTWDPDATLTGPTGQYAIFGVEPGLHTLQYGYYLDDFPVEHAIEVYVPEQGIAAQFPAWVDLAE